MSPSYRFSQALVRLPGDSIAGGLRAIDGGDPDPERFLVEHAAYVRALENAGLTVQVLPALEEFPDSVFIEDNALCLPQGAVILRPGAASRTGETASMIPVLKSRFGQLRRIGEAGFIEGGDVLVTEREIVVGLSGRTDLAGAGLLQDCVAGWGQTVRILKTPSEILHFKTACGLLDDETILLTETMAATGFFNNYTTLIVPAGEETAANVVRVNDQVFVSEGFPKTAELLTNAGYDVVILATYEAAKVDGGLSCMSLRF